MTTRNYPAGTRVRVTVEGTVSYSWLGGYSIQTVGSRRNADDTQIHFVDSDATVEAVRSEVKPGEVWEADGKLWFARQALGMDLIFLLSATGYRDNKLPDEFFAAYPDATLVFEGRS